MINGMNIEGDSLLDALLFEVKKMEYELVIGSSKNMREGVEQSYFSLKKDNGAEVSVANSRTSVEPRCTNY